MWLSGHRFLFDGARRIWQAFFDFCVTCSFVDLIFAWLLKDRLSQLSEGPMHEIFDALVRLPANFDDDNYGTQRAPLHVATNS